MGFDPITFSQAVKKALAKLGVTIENKATEILPETVVKLTLDTVDGGSSGEIPAIGLVPGRKYSVTFNGVKYTCECVKIVENSTTFFLGLGVDNDMMSTGEPFGVIEVYNEGNSAGAQVATFSGADSCTISISVLTETIHPIDPKYLPGLTIDLADYGVDVIGMFVLGGGTANLTDADKLWELVNANRDAPITFHFENSSMAVDTAATKTAGSSGQISGLTATIPVLAQGTYFVAYLWVSLTNVKLTVTAVT